MSCLPFHASLLDPSTGEALRAIGVRSGGIPIWPILGGAEGDGDGGAGDGGGDDKGGAGAGGAGSGGAGGDSFKAPQNQAEFDRMVAERLNRERARYTDYDAVKEKAAKFDAAEAEKASDLEKARAEAKAEGKAEVRSATDKRLIRSEAKAVAAQLKFHNPEDVALVDFSTVTVNEDGEPDAARIKELIEDAVKTRPHLVAAENTGGGQRHDRGQGARTNQAASVSDTTASMNRALGRRPAKTNQ